MNAAALQSAEILVRFTNPAEDGRKPSIKTSDGLYYGVAPADFGRFQPGGRYRIEFTERIWKGKTYRDIKACEPIRSTPAASGGAPAPSPKPSRTEGEGAISNQELHFVTRCLAAAISSCSVGQTHEEIVKRIQLYRAAFQEGFK